MGRSARMSRSPSPASSLDYFQSDGSASEDDYTPHRRGPNKRAAPAPAGQKKATSLKINLSALKRARDVATAHPAEGDIEEDVYDDDGGDGFLGSGAVDLSEQPMKTDHELRPIWVDEYGNMYVFTCLFGLVKGNNHSILEAFAALAPRAQDFLIAISEPVSRYACSLL